MTISEIIFLLDATPLSQTVQTDHKIETVCGSDMMSDVLAFIKKKCTAAYRTEQSAGDPYC